MPDRLDKLGEGILDSARRLVREMTARKAGGHLVETVLDEISLEVTVPVRAGGEAPAAERARELVRRIDRLLDDAIEQAAAFRPGRAFCNRCGGPECEHAVPPSSRHVLVGYGPTGTPRWEDFAQHCLDRRHEETDRLFEDPPALVTLLHDPESLQGEMLGAFDRGRVRLLGQLTAGFFQVRAREEEGRGVVAITFQVAASLSRGGPPRLGLNLLGCAPSGEDLGALWDRQRDLPWRRGVRWAQTALRSIRCKGAVPDERAQRRVTGILQGLARRLERDGRSRRRRTRHAEDRHESGRRPTRKAVEDVRDARDESFLVDERAGTVVVLGDRGRTHFFNREGRLVSSVTYRRDAIGKKIKLGIWRQASGPEADELRSRLGGEHASG